ncbi:MAG: LysM peptidoglycan-binding domain-containing protein, partial [Arthrobacter sp.]
MTTSRSPKPTPRASLPMIAATTAALPAVVLSSLAIAQPAAAESRPRAIPATLAAAMQAQAQAQTARSLASALIPAGSVPATVPSAFRPAQVSAPAEYTIARGDTISGIAGKFGLDTYAVLKLNGLQANTVIYPGQKIKLGAQDTPAAPAPAAPAPSAPAGGTAYTVKSGDTLSAIAARHGVKLSEVFGWNGLNMGSIIRPGQQIKIGAGTAAPAPAAPAPA